MPSIITAGDASNGLVVASGNDGAVVIQSGLAGAKVNALSIAADGAVTAANGLAVTGAVTASGAITAAAGSFTSLDASGALTSASATVIAPTGQAFSRLTATTGTNASYFQANNTGGTLNIGIDSSTGGSLYGLAAYGAAIWYSGSAPVYIGQNNVRRAEFSSTGLAVTGALSCTGALSKGSGSFRVDHPLPELTATRQLVHSFIEGPKADLIYRGKVALVDGQATVNIDNAATMTEGTFEVLCRDVQCFTTNESDWICVRGKVIGNILTIEAEDVAATSVVSWMVIGERQDPHIMETEWTDENGRVIVEPLKPVPPQTLEEIK